MLVRRDDDHFASLISASLSGTAASLVTGSAAVANEPEEFLSFLVLSPFASPWIALFWFLGVGSVGLPIWIALRRANLDSALAGAILGALATGLVWAAGVQVLGQWTDNAMSIGETTKAFLSGAVAGSIAGLVGWRFSRRSTSARAES